MWVLNISDKISNNSKFVLVLFYVKPGSWDKFLHNAHSSGKNVTDSWVTCIALYASNSMNQSKQSQNSRVKGKFLGHIILFSIKTLNQLTSSLQ